MMRVDPGESTSLEVPVARQVEVADRRLGAGGEHDALCPRRNRPECCGPPTVSPSLTVPTQDSGDARCRPSLSRDALARQPSSRCRPRAHLGERREQEHRQHRHDDREDAELDQCVARTRHPGCPYYQNVARRSVGLTEQPFLEACRVQQDALVSVLPRIRADIGGHEGREPFRRDRAARDSQVAALGVDLRQILRVAVALDAHDERRGHQHAGVRQRGPGERRDTADGAAHVVVVPVEQLGGGHQ